MTKVRTYTSAKEMMDELWFLMWDLGYSYDEAMNLMPDYDPMLLLQDNGKADAYGI